MTEQDKEALYQERNERITKATNLEPVDKIPVLWMGIAAMPKMMGMPLSQYHTGPIEDMHVNSVRFADKFGKGEIDGFNQNPPTRIDYLLSDIWLSRIERSGRELPEDTLWQVAEKELVKSPDCYDDIIENGYPQFRAKIMQQVMDDGEIEEDEAFLFEKIEWRRRLYRSHGYVNMTWGVATIPFEALCGARSMTPFFLDLYRTPDKVKEALDVAQPYFRDLALKMIELFNVPRVWVGGWRAASNMLAPDLWEKFVWPYFVETINALHDIGAKTILHWDSDWTRDLARLREVPKGSCILNFDGSTDLDAAAKELAGYHSFMGDVPSALFSAAPPDSTYNYVKRLVETWGPTGLMLCPGCDAPINTRQENFDAYLQAAKDFRDVAKAA